MKKRTRGDDFGYWLKDLRKSAGLNQEELAEQLGVSRITVVNTEKGQSIPKAEFIEKAYKLFGSYDLIIRYIRIQRDKKEVEALATLLYPFDRALASRILNMLVADAMRSNDLATSVINLFQIIMWDLMRGETVYQGKIDTVIKLFEALDSDQFADLLIALYNISFQNDKNFDAYIKITEGIIDKLKLDAKKYSLILNKTASAYYYKSNPHKAYLMNCRAIEMMAGESFPHRGDTYHRHGLICLQLEYFDEAFDHFTKCHEITSEDRLKRLSLVNLARCFYLQKRYSEAQTYWSKLFSIIGKNELNRINSLNDIIMMDIDLGNIQDAMKNIQECKRLLKLAKVSKWAMHDTEALLLKRSEVLLEATRSGNFLSSDIQLILDELQTKTHLRDERELTKNFILERLFSSSKIELS